uniref:Uncharacterized protein n=1 Tax=Oryza brachyantha TaxID=4533 RepID=J3MKL6_ORYBR
MSSSSLSPTKQSSSVGAAAIDVVIILIPSPPPLFVFVLSSIGATDLVAVIILISSRCISICLQAKPIFSSRCKPATARARSHHSQPPSIHLRRSPPTEEGVAMTPLPHRESAPSPMAGIAAVEPGQAGAKVFAAGASLQNSSPPMLFIQIK